MALQLLVVSHEGEQEVETANFEQTPLQPMPCHTKGSHYRPPGKNLPQIIVAGPHPGGEGNKAFPSFNERTLKSKLPRRNPIGLICRNPPTGTCKHALQAPLI